MDWFCTECLCVYLVRSQRSQGSELSPVLSWVSPAHGKSNVWPTPFRGSTLVSMPRVLLLLCQAPLRATVPLGRGLETPPAAQSQSSWKQPLCPEPGCLCMLVTRLSRDPQISRFLFPPSASPHRVSLCIPGWPQTHSAHQFLAPSAGVAGFLVWVMRVRSQFVG